MTTASLTQRCIKLGNIETYSAAYQLIRKLAIAGYIEKGQGGTLADIRPTLAGRAYVKAVERYLRNMRISEY